MLGLARRLFAKRAAVTAQRSFEELVTERRMALVNRYIEQHGRVVCAGPFQGMLLSDRSSWGFGDELPKALGQYESELHDPLLALQGSTQFDVILDIGCADGFYAVGLARLFTDSTVYAYDTDIKARKATLMAASQNGVSDRVDVRGLCDHQEIEALLSGGRRALIFCDCEGGERELVDLIKAPSLRQAFMVIECHDCMMPGITEELLRRLQESHSVTRIDEGSRNPNGHEFQKGLWSVDRWLTVCEFRPELMHWLICRPN